MKDFLRRLIGRMLDQYATVLLVLGAVSTAFRKIFTIMANILST